MTDIASLDSRARRLREQLVDLRAEVSVLRAEAEDDLAREVLTRALYWIDDSDHVWLRHFDETSRSLTMRAMALLGAIGSFDAADANVRAIAHALAEMATRNSGPIAPSGTRLAAVASMQ